MNPPSDFTQFQAQSHPLIVDDRFYSLEEYCLHLMHLKAYEDAAKIVRDSTVLDLGCNVGHGTMILARQSKKVVGLDVSSRAVERARERFGHLNGIEFKLFSGEHLPFDDASFDVVVSFQVIEHVERTKEYLSEIARVLRSDGVALFTTPNAEIRLDSGMRPWNEFHIREYTPPDLAAATRAAFYEVKIRGLFATEPLYGVEFERVQRERRAAQERGRMPAKAPTTGIRDGVKEMVKAILPNAVLELVRSPRNRGGSAAEAPKWLDEAALSRYSTKDLFYRDVDLQNALDLLAVCRGPIKAA